MTATPAQTTAAADGRGATQRTHGGRLAAEALRRAGVTTVFAVPGGHVLHLLDGCLDVGIRVVHLRHEGAAALAAEGWALATGQPGVVVATAGPGFANALVGVADAGAWTVPLVLLGGRTGIERQGRGAVMDIDQAAMVAPVVDHVLRCHDPERVMATVGQALHLARAGRPGPVYVEIPMDVYAAEASLPAAGVTRPPGGPAPVGAGRPADVRATVDLLAGAERPVAIAGSGAFWSAAGDRLAAFAERTGVPVVTASAARGLLPDDHEGCLGGILHGGGAMLMADAVLVLGSAFNANLAYGGPPLFRPDQQVVQVDLDAAAIGGNRRPDVAVVGDVGEVLAAVTDAWPDTVDRLAGWREQARDVVRAMQAEWDRQVDDHDGDLLHAGEVARTTARVIRERTDGAVTVVCDGGDALAWGMAYTTAHGPGRLLTTTTALGTLGVGLPFALAARAARPDEPVVLFTGDGSFGLSAMELDSCVRHGLPVVCVVSNNASWGDVAHEQDAWFGPGRRVGSDLAGVRYDLLARAVGADGHRVTRREELVPALEAALDAGRPAVVDVATDPEVLSELLRNVSALGVM